MYCWLPDFCDFEDCLGEGSFPETSITERTSFLGLAPQAEMRSFPFICSGDLGEGLDAARTLSPFGKLRLPKRASLNVDDFVPLPGEHADPDTTRGECLPILVLLEPKWTGTCRLPPSRTGSCKLPPIEQCDLDSIRGDMEQGEVWILLDCSGPRCCRVDRSVKDPSVQVAWWVTGFWFEKADKVLPGRISGERADDLGDRKLSPLGVIKLSTTRTP